MCDTDLEKLILNWSGFLDLIVINLSVWKWYHWKVYYNLFITLLLAAKAKTLIAKQQCCMQTKMYRLYKKYFLFNQYISLCVVSKQKMYRLFRKMTVYTIYSHFCPDCFSKRERYRDHFGITKASRLMELHTHILNDAPCPVPLTITDLDLLFTLSWTMFSLCIYLCFLNTTAIAI